MIILMHGIGGTVAVYKTASTPRSQLSTNKNDSVLGSDEKVGLMKVCSGFLSNQDFLRSRVNPSLETTG